MEKQIVAHLESHGATKIVFDGAWVTFVSNTGKNCYASRSELYKEWACGR
jgi:hypothetical protein